MSGALERFHPAVRTWFERRFAEPSRVQKLGWPAIGGLDGASAADVLLCAPTGSGKTLAAFMWAINRLVAEAERGELRDEVSVLYVSPLKALANDIRINLDEPLDGVRAAGAELGLTLASVRAGLRTGDTPVAERGAMLRLPPHILVTTPESLFILLTSPRFREKLRAVRFVIVDELHAIAGNKRGAHLMVTLERLERMVRAGGAPRPARIGLSATLNPIEKLAEFLAGAEIDRDGHRTPRRVEIVRADDRPREMDLRVIAPGPELGPIATHPHWEAMYDAIAELVREHRTTLIFTLSRRWAERIALNLQKRVGADAVMAHHGSLARKERLAAEQRLKAGELKAIVATASLELGIDVGAVDLVCQIDSPKSISAAIQRIGRSGHQLGATPKGRFFALTLDDLAECAAAVRAIRSGRLDEVEIPSGCADVAAQQIVAIAAEEGEITEQELLRVLRAARNFSSLSFEQLRKLLDELAAERPERIRGAAPKIFHDRIGGRVRPRRGARLAAITSGGTIPESGNYDVIVESTGRKIGDVEEDFAQESSRGDVFSLGSMPWQIRRISRGRLLVEAAPGMAPSLPFWQAEAGGRSIALSEEICALKREIAARLGESNGDPAGGAIKWLVRECALDEHGAEQLVSYVRRGVGALGVVPDPQNIVVERFFDGLGGTQIVIHSPLGIKLNRGLGLAIRKRLCQSFDFEIQASAIDDGVLLALNSRHSFALEQILTMVTARTARDVLVQALLDAPMFEVRFRHVATRALSVIRNMKGQRVPAWIQRLRSQELLAALFPGQQACFENRPAMVQVPDHFIVSEAIKECLEESTDLPRLQEMLSGLEEGRVRARFVDAISPSVFAQRLLLAWDYSFLDDGERANRRSRTVTMNRGLAEDVFRKEDLSTMLAEEVVAQVAAEVAGTASNRRARDCDELYEMIRAHGALAFEAIEERVTGGGAKAHIERLEGEKRIARVRIAADAAELLIAAEDAALYSSAYSDDAAGAQDREAARKELVQRALKTSAIVTAREIGARLGLPADEVEQHLAALEASGAIFRGHFTSADVEQWCDRYNLERIHRGTLARVRAEVEPCTDHEFAAFRLRWQHLGGAGLDGDDALAIVLEQLAGVALAPEFWERAVLPARLPGYRPEALDLLCLSGRIFWVAGPEDCERAAPSRVALLDRRRLWLSSARTDEPHEGAERAVHQALTQHGAQYLDQVADHSELSERVVLAALWRLAAAGQAANDSFAPLRLIAESPDLIRSPGAPHVRALTKHDAVVRARLKSSVSGRWSAIVSPQREAGADHDRMKELALVLLGRHGILSREMLQQESIPCAWQDLSFVLRRMEYAGLIQRGYFVRALSGEQYALPAAVQMLRSVRSSIPAREALIALSAADPANPYGALVAGCGIAREPSNVIVIRAGRPMMGLAGRTLSCIEPLDDDAFGAAVAALIAFRKPSRVEVGTIDAEAALVSSRVGLLAAMRFHSDGSALIYDGLPGPAPRRAARPLSG